MKIELEISDKNEGTESPWWFLIDPRPIRRLCEGAAEEREVPGDSYIISAVAMSTIEGPYFSREEAERYLKARAYEYSKETIVWCGSGYHSQQYKQAIRKAREAPQRSDEAKE